jgi:hypothetical protein
MESKQVVVKSTVRAQVSVNVPSLNLRRSWAKKGAIQKIPFDVLEQAYYEPGVEYLFRTGALYIDDMEVKIALGLEDPEATVPTNVIEMNDEYAKKLLTATALKDLRIEVEKLSHEQLLELARMAIDMKLTDYHRCEILKSKTGIDVMTASIARQEEEAEKAAE